jgi:hypothetical protein
MCANLSPEDWTALRSKVWDAQTLARTILGKDTTHMTSADLLEAMKTFASMKEELAQLQRESQLTQQALVATQCSKTCLSKRLDKIADESEVEEETIDFSEDFSLLDDEDHPELLPEQDPEADDDEEEDEEGSEMDVAHPEDNLEEEIMMIVPTKSKSLGVGLLGDMEQCIVEWQTSFEELNAQHENQVQACQADLERLHVRIDAMKALNPTGVEAAAAAQRARDQLEKLIAIVEAFPSKAKVEALVNELEASKRAEEGSHEALARAMEELEAARQREEVLLRRLEEAESFARQSAESPITVKTRTVPARLLRFTKKKLQRLFRLDRLARRNQSRGESHQVESQDDHLAMVSSTIPSSIIEEGLPECSSDSGICSTAEAPHPLEPDVLLRVVSSGDDDLLLVFSASDNESSDEEDEVDRDQDLDELSFSDSIDGNNYDEDLLAHIMGSFTPTKQSPSSSVDDECEMDLSKVTTADTILSYATDATTSSSSGTPPSKATKKKRDMFVQPESKGIFAMAKSFLWVQ